MPNELSSSQPQDSDTQSWFNVCATRLYDHEGGWTNDINDPGGETKFGISRRSYPNVDFDTLMWEDAKAIYFTDFWQPLPAVPSSISFQLFDFAVHSGVSTAVRYLQRTLNIADDGIWGPISRQTMNDTSERDAAIGLLANRLEFMTRLSNWPHASRGWSRRISKNMHYALEDLEI